MIVIDTNVVAYLLIEGERTSACRRAFAKDPEWCAPFLWRSEFRNVLTMHMRHDGDLVVWPRRTDNRPESR